MRSLDAFLAAGPRDLAAAVLVHGLTGQAVSPDRFGTVKVVDVLAAVVHGLGVTDERPGSRRWDEVLATPPFSDLPSAVNEGVLTGERYLCLMRTFTGTGTAEIRLLRRGRHALVSGDPFLYLRD
jgi:hypothetical protein